LNQTPHVADAFGAADVGLAMTEDLNRLLGACCDGRARIAVANSVAVADVHGALQRSLKEY
jgi:hypothetical protein